MCNAHTFRSTTMPPLVSVTLEAVQTRLIELVVEMTVMPRAPALDDRWMEILDSIGDTVMQSAMRREWPEDVVDDMMVFSYPTVRATAKRLYENLKRKVTEQMH